MLASRIGDASVVLLCGALLHDVVEDTPVTLADISREFGAEVAALVAEVSDDRTLSRTARKQAQIEHAPMLSYDAAMIKIADKFCNVRDLTSDPPTGWSAERLRAYVGWAEKVVWALPHRHPVLSAEFFEVCAHAHRKIARIS